MALPNRPFDIPGYRFIRRIGRGGMATVYLALQNSLKRPVAIKILSSEQIPGEKMAARFEQEARTIARLDHPHIVSIFDVGRDKDGQLYYTMPYLPNGDLRRQQIGSDENRIIDVMRALASALGYAHSQGIVHRDVKPENVLFDALKRPLLADFGIAFSTTNHDRLTREGATLGSSGYMSPEQAMGHPLDGRSDLYSLGVLCYELLTGDRPFRGPDTLSVALAHLNEPVRRLPPERRHWQAIIDQSLAKSPAARYQNAEQLVAALDEIDERVSSPLATLWIRTINRLSAVWTRTISRLPAVAPSGYLLVAGIAFTTTIIAVVGWKTFSRASATSPTAPVATVDTQTTTSVDVAPTPASAEIDRLLGEASALKARGQMTAPPGDNAAERYLAILKADPGNIQATTALREIFSAALVPGNPATEEKPRADAGVAALDATLIADTPPVISAAAAPAPATSPASDTTGTPQPQAPRKAATSRKTKPDLSTEKTILRAGERLRDPSGPLLAYVPENKSDGTDHDKPLHAFAAAITDVTRGEYAEFTRATGRTESPCREPMSLLSRMRDLSWHSPGFVQDDTHPVVCVSWHDADAYAHWLSLRTGQTYRLPTQQEWLHVARQTAKMVACATGNVGDSTRGGITKHFDCSDGFARTSPVGSFPPSPLGLADLAGNVSVWMGDCASADCRQAWFRGLSWRDGPSESNLELRGQSASDIGYTTIGLRVVRDVSE